MFIIIFLFSVLFAALAIFFLCKALYNKKNKNNNDNEKSINDLKASICLAIITLITSFNVSVPAPTIYPINSESQIYIDDVDVTIGSNIVNINKCTGTYYSLNELDPKDGTLYNNPINIDKSTTISVKNRFLWYWSEMEQRVFKFDENDLNVTNKTENKIDENLERNIVVGENTEDTLEQASQYENIAEEDFQIQQFPDDYVITWENETFGELIQKCLNKNEITYADVKNIESLYIDSMNNEMVIDDHADGAFINSPENRSGSISLNDLKYFTSLINLDIWNYETVNCAIFENTNYLKKLSAITFVSNISTEQLEQIAKLQNINSLCIFENSLNLRDIETISSIESMESLIISMCNVTDITPLSNMTKLEYLDISYNEISNIDALKDLSNLQTAVLYSNNITDYSPVSHVKETVKTLEEYIEFVYKNKRAAISSRSYTTLYPH